MMHSYPTTHMGKFKKSDRRPDLDLELPPLSGDHHAKKTDERDDLPRQQTGRNRAGTDSQLLDIIDRGGDFVLFGR